MSSTRNLHWLNKRIDALGLASHIWTDNPAECRLAIEQQNRHLKLCHHLYPGCGFIQDKFECLQRNLFFGRQVCTQILWRPKWKLKPSGYTQFRRGQFLLSSQPSAPPLMELSPF